MLTILRAQAQVEKADINELLFKQGGLLYEHAEYGVSIGIVKGKQVFFINAGRRAGRKAPVDSATLFEIGSVTKTFTGLMLAEQMVGGNIKQDSYIDAYLPPHFILQTRLQHKIKLTDLASHQSGLPNLSNGHDPYLQDLTKQNPAQPFSLVNTNYIYKVLSETKSLSGYGDYQYNNYAYALLGQLLQNAGRQSYWQLLQTGITRPFKLTHTTLGNYSSKNTAARFSADGKVKPAIQLNALAPAGALISNAADMVKYLQIQLNPPRMAVGKAIKLTQQPFYQGDRHIEGLGWDIFPHYIEKSGDTFGNSSLLRIDPRHHLGIVVLSDHQDSKLVEDIADAVFEALDKND